jgi:hypothetical protein
MHQLVSRFVLGMWDGQHFVTRLFEQLHTQYRHTIRFRTSTTHISVVPCQNTNSAIISNIILVIPYLQRIKSNCVYCKQHLCRFPRNNPYLPLQHTTSWCIIIRHMDNLFFKSYMLISHILQAQKKLTRVNSDELREWILDFINMIITTQHYIRNSKQGNFDALTFWHWSFTFKF